MPAQNVWRRRSGGPGQSSPLLQQYDGSALLHWQLVTAADQGRRLPDNGRVGQCMGRARCDSVRDADSDASVGGARNGKCGFGEARKGWVSDLEHGRAAAARDGLTLLVGPTSLFRPGRRRPQLEIGYRPGRAAPPAGHRESLRPL